MYILVIFYLLGKYYAYEYEHKLAHHSIFLICTYIDLIHPFLMVAYYCYLCIYMYVYINTTYIYVYTVNSLYFIYHRYPGSVCVYAVNMYATIHRHTHTL